jgi:hypothetical protein
MKLGQTELQSCRTSKKISSKQKLHRKMKRKKRYIYIEILNPVFSFAKQIFKMSQWLDDENNGFLVS